MGCLNLKKTEKHNINAWFTSTEVNENFAIDFNSSLCPLIMKVARMIYKKPQREFSVSPYPNFFFFLSLSFFFFPRCITKYTVVCSWIKQFSILDVIWNYIAALGGVLMLRRSRTTHSLHGS